MFAIIIRTEQGEGVLRIIGENLEDLSEPFTEIGKLALEDARQVIAIHGGGSWAQMHELTPVIARIFGGERTPETLLEDTGGLVNSLIPFEASNIFEVGPMDASFGSQYTSPRTNFGIAKWQQEGTEKSFLVLQGAGYAPGGIAAREFLSWRGERLDEYDATLTRHVEKGAE